MMLTKQECARAAKILLAWIGVFAVIALFFLARNAIAAEPKYLPAWEMRTCGTGSSAAEFACYTLEGAKALVKLDLDLQLKIGEYSSCIEARNKAYEATGTLSAALQKQEDTTRALETRLLEKQDLLLDTTEKLKKAEANSVTYWLPWIVTGVVVFAAAGFTAGYLVR